MKYLMALAVSIAVGLALHCSVWGQLREGPAHFRIALKDEDILMEPDPEAPGRYTLFWEGTVVIDARSRDQIKLVGEAMLSPLGQWTPSPTSRFGTSSLVPGINSLHQKFAVASIDLPQGTRFPRCPPMGALFDHSQVIKLRLAVMRQGYWVGAPALAEVKYDLKPLGYALLSAAAQGDVSEARRLMEKGADPDSATVQKWTALMEAASRGHRGVVRALLDHGAKVNEKRNGFPFVTTELGARFPSGETALIAACSYGDPETVRILLRAGARVNVERSDRWTALMAAAYGGHPYVVSMLLARRAAVNVVDESNYSPTALAVINGHPHIVRMLKARGDVVRVPWDELTRP
jgi:hypothetical protein